MEKKRSIGVTLFSNLYIISGIIGLILSVMLFSSRNLNTIMLTVSILYLVIGNGLLKLKEKARKWAIYLSTVAIIYGLVECFTKGFRAWNFVIPAMIIYFFTRPKVKEQFK